MNQPPLFLSSADLNMMYQKLLQNPHLAPELSAYHKTELYHYAEDEALNATRTVVDMMDRTPNYPYPEEYRNGREVEYLLGKHSPRYWDSQRVLQLLAERKVAPQPAEIIPAVSLAEVKPTAGTTAPEVTPSLTHRRLVLLCLYRNQPITELNCERVAKMLESNTPNVAVVLWRKWKEWGSVLAVRNAKGKRTVIPLIEDMQWIIIQLNDEQKKVADNDLRYIMREIN